VCRLLPVRDGPIGAGETRAMRPCARCESGITCVGVAREGLAGRGPRRAGSATFVEGVKRRGADRVRARRAIRAESGRVTWGG